MLENELQKQFSAQVFVVFTKPYVQDGSIFADTWEDYFESAVKVNTR